MALTKGIDGDRIAVFNRNGKLLRKWDVHRTAEERDIDKNNIQCLALSNDGNVYTCDPSASRIQVFDKMGKFKTNFMIRHEEGESAPKTAPWTAMSIAFSRDPEQRYMFVANRSNEQVDVVERASGRIVSSFGRPGHLLGGFTILHFLDVDSRGRVYVAELTNGQRVQRFEPSR
jgi:hypothetical protein